MPFMLSIYLEYTWSIIGGQFLQKEETGFEHQAIVCFVKQSKGDLAHTENVCFIPY